MAQFVRIPLERVESETLQAMLEDFASRDGTDYGLRELSLQEKVANLLAQLGAGELALVFDLDSEEWDLLGRDQLEGMALS
jgi:uncharacterized protein YheU (UPF0270 family)